MIICFVIFCIFKIYAKIKIIDRILYFILFKIWNKDIKHCKDRLHFSEDSMKKFIFEVQKIRI